MKKHRYYVDIDGKTVWRGVLNETAALKKAAQIANDHHNRHVGGTVDLIRTSDNMLIAQFE